MPSLVGSEMCIRDSNNVEKALEVGKDFKEEIKKDIFELIEAIQKDENKSNE